MSIELHRSAWHDQAPAAGQPAEAGALAEPGSSDARGGSDAPGAPDTRSASRATAEPGASGATSSPGVSFTPSAPDTRSASGATAEPSASAGASGAAVREPPRDAGPGWPPADPRLDESSVDLDGPLLADAAGLHASWRRVQAGFVDDPRDAVADAASLVEHAAQALVGALRQRQQLLRATWDRDRSTGGLGAPAGGSPEGAGPADSGRPALGDVPDTEELRLLMHRYRDLFNHICQP